MIDLVVAADLVVTMDPSRRVIANGAVAIDKGRILAIDTAARIDAAFPDAARRIANPDTIAMPGFVDGHSHAGHGLVRTLGADDFPIWRQACHDIYMGAATLDFWRAEARLNALERIKAGVTTATVYLGGGNENNRSDDPEIAETYASSFTEIGGRIVLGIGPTRPPFPRAYARFDGGAKSIRQVGFQDQFAVCREVLRGLPGARISVALTTPCVDPGIHAGAHFEELCGISRAMRALSDEFGAVLMIDGNRHGTIAFAHDRLGILNERTLLSHCIDIDADEIAIAADRGVTIANNPVSTTAVWGRCPVPELLAAGARVIMCTDGLAPDCGSDVFDVMRRGMHYHRAMARDPHLLPPGRVLSMTTIEPAQFFGLGAAIGSLEAGKAADLIVTDMNKPHLRPQTMPLYALMYGATAQDVDTAIVGGKVVMQSRKVIGVDEDAILAAADLEAEKMLDRAGLPHLAETPAEFWTGNAYRRSPYRGPFQPPADLAEAS